MNMKTLIVMVVVLRSACWCQSTPQQPQPAKAGQVGRFQLVLYQGEMPRMNTYLLDTVTGKIWMMVSAPDATTFWEPMLRVDNDLEGGDLRGKHQKKKEPADK